MTTYKMVRIKDGKLYPLFVLTSTEIHLGEWLPAKVGEVLDETHIKSKIGPLALRPGWHSTKVPFTDWIGKKQGGRLVQRKDTVWCECEVNGEEIRGVGRKGLKDIPKGWYYFRTVARQSFPWVISGHIKIVRVLSRAEVVDICRKYGIRAQPMED